jgi:RNA-dependent RNA polymerase
MIRNVLVTPTRVLIGAPQQEPSNSVTRRYADKLEGIARVTFTDEEDNLYVSAPSSLNVDWIRLVRRPKSTTSFDLMWESWLESGGHCSMVL